VLAIAALGVLALMDGWRTRRGGVDGSGRLWAFAEQPLLLRVAASVVLPLAMVFSMYIFMRGHNLPGGGFIAGLITAVALVLQFMALGQARAEWLMHVHSGRRFCPLDWRRLGHSRPHRCGCLCCGVSVLNQRVWPSGGGLVG